MGEHATRPEKDHDAPARHDPEPTHAEGAHERSAVRARIVSMQQSQRPAGGAGGSRQDEDMTFLLEVDEVNFARVYNAVQHGLPINMHGANIGGRNGMATSIQGNYVRIEFKRSDITFKAPEEDKDGQRPAVDMTVYLEIP